MPDQIHTSPTARSTASDVRIYNTWAAPFHGGPVMRRMAVVEMAVGFRVTFFGGGALDVGIRVW